MSGGIALEISLQDQKFIAGLLRAAGAQKQFNSEVEKTKAQAEKAEKELDKLAASTKKLIATPLEKYNAELAKLNTLQQRGKLTADEYTRAVAQQKAQLDQATIGMQKLGMATTKAGSNKSSILEIAGSLGMITTAAGAATFAIGKVTEAIKFASQQAKDAANEAREMQQTRANLVQISGGDPQKYAQLKSEAKDLEEMGYTREAAGGLVFSAYSEGWQKELKQVAGVGQLVGDEKALSITAGQIPAMYANQGVKIGSLEAVNMNLKAAEQSRLDFAPMATAFVQGAEGATKAGTSPTELAALASFLASEYKSGDVAGQRISSIGADIAKTDRLRGKGHMGAFRELRDNYTEEERKSWLGEDQSKNLWYQSMMVNEGSLVQREKEIIEEQKAFARGDGLVHRSMAIIDNDPTFRATKATQIEQNRLDRVKEEKLAQHGLSVEGGMAKAERQDLERGANGLARSALLAMRSRPKRWRHSAAER